MFDVIVTRETQVKATGDPTSHPRGWLQSRGQRVTSAGEGVEKPEPPNTPGGNGKWCSHQLSNSTARCMPRQRKAYVHAETGTQMFTEALFRTAKKMSNPNVYQLKKTQAKLDLSVH